MIGLMANGGRRATASRGSLMRGPVVEIIKIAE